MTPQELVCVTGASGFVASQVIRDLLARGYRVRGTVRSLKKQEAVSTLVQLPGAAERLELVEADLLDAPSLVAAVRGCAVVMHTASPYIMAYKDAQRELVDPAVNGTRDTLIACKAAGTVKRVVLTSSMEAIYDQPEARALDEKDWNTKSSLTRNAYSYSKTQAERAAWAFVDAEKPAFDLVAVNPAMIIGPSIVPSLNVSNKLIADLLSGAYPGVLALGWGFVDVRDVARAHVLAGENPSAKGRHVCVKLTLTMRELTDHLARVAPGFKLPKLSLDNRVGSFIARAAATFYPPGARDFVRTNIGGAPLFDHAKIERELGLQFSDLDTTLKDTVEDLVKWGHVAKPRAQ